MIILCDIQYQRTMKWLPYGVLYVASALKKAGFEIKIYHFSVEQIDRYIEKISKDDPFLVGISVMIDPIIKHIIIFSKKLKSKLGVPIVWGRTHPSLVPYECLELDCVDYIVKGDGEEAMVELARVLKNKNMSRLKNIPGVGYKYRNKIYFGEHRPFVKNLDKFSLNWKIIDIEKYISSNPLIKSKKFFNFITSRGCIFNCGFCYNIKLNNRQWRSHSADFIIRNVEYIQKKYHVDTIRFVDDNFFADRERAFKILNNVRLNVSLNCNIIYITDDFVQKLKNTRCVELFLGIESGSDRILNLINKRITKKEIVRAIKLLALIPDIKVIGSIIFNLPTETKEEFEETIRLMLDLLKVRSTMEFRASKYIPQPGTPLFDRIVIKSNKYFNGDWKRDSFKYHLNAGANPEIKITNKDIDKLRRYLENGT